MEYAELTKRTVEELKELLATTRAQLHALRVKASSRALKQVHEVAIVRHTVARILTALKSK